MTKHKKRRHRPKSTSPQVPPRPPRRTAAQRARERPERLNAPWHPFPLVELCVLMGIVCFVVGLFTRDDAGGRVLIAIGVGLGALGGLDTSAREHFAGYRSHTFVLAGFPAVVAAAVIALAQVPLFVVVPVMLGVFLAAFVALRRAWERTSARSAA